MTKRSMLPPLNDKLFALTVARCCCHDIGGFVIVNRLVRSNLTPLRQIRWGGSDGDARSRGVICVGVRAARYTGTAQTMAPPAGAPSVR